MRMRGFAWWDVWLTCMPCCRASTCLGGCVSGGRRGVGCLVAEGLEERGEAGVADRVAVVAQPGDQCVPGSGGGRRGAVRPWRHGLRQRFQLSYWDSAIIAASRAMGCAEVLSEDLGDGQ